MSAPFKVAEWKYAGNHYRLIKRGQAAYVLEKAGKDSLGDIAWGILNRWSLGDDDDGSETEETLDSLADCIVQLAGCSTLPAG
jgi:hypothetical protein